MPEQPTARAAVSRRTVLAGAGAVAVGAWWPVRVADRAGAMTCAPPPDFPAGIELYRQAYRNWVGEIRVDDAWTCAPRTPLDVVAVVNWAVGHGYRVRAQGYRHGWAPLTVATGGGCEAPVLLVDTTRHLTGLNVVSTAPAAVRVQAGASMEALLGFCENAGLGVTAAPAPGDLSVGGVLAIGGHGTAVPAAGETRPAGHTYGSLSNLVLSLTAVVWDAAAGRYVLRSFDRAQPEGAALLTHLGRAFVTEVTLRVGANQHLRCLSLVDVPADELFAPPGSGAVRTFASYLDDAGRAEAIWFAYTSKPWLKVWSVAPTRPLTSRPVTTPYNYPFSDNVPKPVAELAAQVVAGSWELAPLLGQAQYDATAAGLVATASVDLWGPSKNLLLYIKPTTLRLRANGWAVLTRRAAVQQVVSAFVAFYRSRLDAYTAAGRYPVNGSVEIRVTGLDTPADVGVPGAVPPALSALRPRPDHPEWDTAVWLDVLTLPGTPSSYAFFRELETFLLGLGAGSVTRVEWSKEWAYTDTAAWAEPAVLTGSIPASFAGGGPDWPATAAQLAAYDPHRVFTNPLLTQLFG